MEMATATQTAATVSAMKWEKFMPKMMTMMRVLLVEADDSTRQVVVALLRKCNYRVEAVTDGLEAWEVLKKKPRNFDLILAEVELPSITGFALLTLIMEHDICRNIPVIMMSSQGLDGNIYKCMQRGAADYLLKPIRGSELRNLWQHVWRRRSRSVDGSLLQSEDEIVPLREAEASKQIIVSIDHAQTDYEFIQKQTGLQVVCEGLSLELCSSQRSSTKADEEAAAKASLSSCSFALNPSPSENAEHEISRKDENCAAKEAIDLIGTLQNHKRSHYCIDFSSHHHSSNLDCPLQLDLCLKRTSPNDDDGSVLAVKQSGATSAFSRYINKTLHTETELPHDFNRYSSDTPSPALSTPKSILSLSNTQSQQPLPLSGHRSLPTSVPVIVLRSDSSCTDFASEKMVAQQGFSQILHRNNNGHTLESLRLDALMDKASSYPSTIGTANVNRVFHMTPGEDGLMIPDGNSQQPLLQREAVLMKFRLKRKLRCFDKKVRYESRKKLAEKRPRVKGQFVRHVNVDTVP